MINELEKWMEFQKTADISYLADEIPDRERVFAVFQSIGCEKLKPVRVMLGNRHDYADLRLARLLFRQALQDQAY